MWRKRFYREDIVSAKALRQVLAEHAQRPARRPVCLQLSEEMEGRELSLDQGSHRGL